MPGASNPLRRGLLKAVLAAREVTALGPATFAAMAANTVRAERRRRRDDRLEWRPATTRTPGHLVSATPLDATAAGLVDATSLGAVGEAYRTVGARCTFTEAVLEVAFLAADLVRLSWGPAEPPIPWALAPAPPAGWGVEVVVEPGTVAQSGAVTQAGVAGVTVSSSLLRVEVALEGTVRFLRPNGVLVRRELPPLRRGAARVARFELRPDERVAGMGEQASRVDLRGGTRRLWNRDPGGAWGPGTDPLYCAVPVLVGVHPDDDVLAFFENSFDATVRIGAPGPAGPAQAELSFSGGMDRHYVSVGSLAQVLARYGELTGRPTLPPRWALGYHQCRWGYRTAEDVRAVVRGFAEEGLPLSAVHLDIDHMDGYRVFTVDRRRFPDLAGLVRELAEREVHVVTIVDPGVKVDPEYHVFDQGRAGNRFVLDDDGEPLVGVVWPGRAVFPDFTDPATRGWWADCYAPLLGAGVAGIWHDMNEPTSFTLWGDRTLPKSARHVAEGRGADHRQCHNVYGLLMNRAGYEALVTARPDRRPFLLSRAGWAGMQRWAWNWTGDIESSWHGLRQQVATAIGLGLSGVPHTGSDVGGFSGVPTPELYVRWLELSVLMPFCRTHSVLGSPPREPWCFPEPYRVAIGRLIRFRYRLLPYLYTAAWSAASTGHPIVRPLCWTVEGRSSADRRLWQADDAYLLGDALLVAPVTRQSGRRQVVLPAGTWYRWSPVRPMGSVSGGEGADETVAAGSGAPRQAVGGDEVSVVEGGRSVSLTAPLGMAPLFVRAGSVLVLDDAWTDDGRAVGTAGTGTGGGATGATSTGATSTGATSTGATSTGATSSGAESEVLPLEGHRPRRPAVWCFPTPEGDATGVAYDDEGDGYGPSRVDRFELHADGERAVVLRWWRDGAFPPPDRLRVVVAGLSAASAAADGRPLDVRVTTGGSGLPATVVECPSFEELRLQR